MPTPPRTYSPAAAEKLRRALLALAASAATLTAHAQDAEGNFDDPDVLGEVPEDIELGGDIGGFIPCEKESCPSDDRLCDDACAGGKPCTPCDMPSGAEAKSHAEAAETKPHAESAEVVTVATIVSGRYPTQPISTNAPAAPAQREAGSVPEASASGPAPVPPDRIRTRGRLRPEP